MFRNFHKVFLPFIEKVKSLTSSQTVSPHWRGLPAYHHFLSLFSLSATPANNAHTHTHTKPHTHTHTHTHTHSIAKLRVTDSHNCSLVTDQCGITAILSLPPPTTHTHTHTHTLSEHHCPAHWQWMRAVTLGQHKWTTWQHTLSCCTVCGCESVSLTSAGNVSLLPLITRCFPFLTTNNTLGYYFKCEEWFHIPEALACIHTCKNSSMNISVTTFLTCDVRNNVL